MLIFNALPCKRHTKPGAKVAKILLKYSVKRIYTRGEKMRNIHSSDVKKVTDVFFFMSKRWESRTNFLLWNILSFFYFIFLHITFLFCLCLLRDCVARCVQSHLIFIVHWKCLCTSSRSLFHLDFFYRFSAIELEMFHMIHQMLLHTWT